MELRYWFYLRRNRSRHDYILHGRDVRVRTIPILSAHLTLPALT